MTRTVTERGRDPPAPFRETRPAPPGGSRPGRAAARDRRNPIAVSSGKGGVGKTITACNLAIYYARKGLRVGLVDLDPLSDVASLLDIYESEQAVRERATRESPARMGSASVHPARLQGPGDPLPLPEARPRARPAASWRRSTGSTSRRSTRATTCCIFDMPGRHELRRQSRLRAVHEAARARDEPRADGPCLRGRLRQGSPAPVPGHDHPSLAQPLLAQAEGRISSQRRGGQLQPVRAGRGPAHPGGERLCSRISRSSPRIPRSTCSRGSPAPPSTC